MGKASIGSSRGTFEYNPDNKEEKKQAYMKAFDMSSEKYDEIQADIKKKDDEFAKNYPALVDLVWADDEMYYLIDGKRVEVADRLEEIKEQIAASFNTVASDTCKVHHISQIDDPNAEPVLELTKEDRVNMLMNQIDKDVKRA